MFKGNKMFPQGALWGLLLFPSNKKKGRYRLIAALFNNNAADQFVKAAISATAISTSRSAFAFS